MINMQEKKLQSCVFLARYFEILFEISSKFVEVGGNWALYHYSFKIRATCILSLSTFSLHALAYLPGDSPLQWCVEETGQKVQVETSETKKRWKEKNLLKKSWNV